MKEKTAESENSILGSGIEIIGDEIKLHPVISGVAAFSVGFIVAALIFRSGR